jgi:uncharacterized protein (TIGR03435 family)
MYTLTVAKNGHKMKEAVMDPNPPAMVDGAGIGAGRGGPPSPPFGPGSPPPKDKDGFPMPGRGNWASTFSEGRTKMTATSTSMSDLTNMLSRQLGHQVFDKTGLTGKYAFRVEYGADGTLGPPVPMRMPPGAVAPTSPVNGLSDASGPTIFRALQDQLGLRLEPGKVSTDVIVIEKAEKAPIEN